LLFLQKFKIEGDEKNDINLSIKKKIVLTFYHTVAEQPLFHASLAIEYNRNKSDLRDEILSCPYENKENLFQYFSQQQVDDFKL